MIIFAFKGEHEKLPTLPFNTRIVESVCSKAISVSLTNLPQYWC